MSHTTPVYALPYPDEADSADVPRDMQALAQRLEAVLPNVGLPTGAGIDWYAAAAPPGFLLCDGSAVNRITFAALFAAIGTTWGGGDGINTFNLPDTRGRVIVGVAPGGNLEVAALGANDGTAVNARRVRHAHTVNLTLPAHGHAVNDPGHAHGLPTLASLEGTGYWQYGMGGNVTGAATATAAAGTGISIGNPTSAPGINGSVGVLGGTADGPSFVVAAKAIRT